MKVFCQRNKWYMFSPKEVAKGNDRVTTYNGVHVGDNYSVYGIILYEKDLMYLLFDEFDMPNWYPAELFTVIDGRLPLDWHHVFYGAESNLSAIWGYDELVHSDEHYEGLCEQEVVDVVLFLRRKREMDLQSEETHDKN